MGKCHIAYLYSYEKKFGLKGSKLKKKTLENKMIVFLLVRNKLKGNKICALNSLFSIQNVIVFSTLVRRSTMFQPKFLVYSVHVWCSSCCLRRIAHNIQVVIRQM